MELRSGILGFFLCISWISVAPAGGETVESGRNRDVPVFHATHAQYTVNLTAASKQEGTRLTTIELLFGFRGAENTYRLHLARRNARLEVTEKGATRALAQGTGPFLAKTGPQKVSIRRRRHRLYVVVNGIIAVQTLDATFAKGAVCVRAQKELDITDLRYQPLEDIALDDDFMQTAEDAKDLGDIEPVSGKWALRSILDEVTESGHVTLRKGRSPEAERSPNPFSLAATTKDESVAVTGYPFWDDYRAAVSAKTRGGSFGLIFAYRGPEDYFVLRWRLTRPMLHAGPIELVKRSPDGERVLDRAAAQGRTGNWYRLHATAVAGRIRAGIDDTVVFDLDDRTCTGGRIGLYAAGSEMANFDDLSIRSENTIRFDRPEDLARYGASLSGRWRLSRPNGDVELIAPRSARALYSLGCPDWSDYVFQSRAWLTETTTEVGLACTLKDPGDYLLCCVVRAPGGRKAKVGILRMEDDERRWVTHFPAEVNAGQQVDLALDLTETGYLRFYVDGELEIRHKLKESLVGKPALFATGGASFTDLQIFGTLERDLDRPVGREIYVNDPYMQGWATSKWAWFPVDRPKDPSRPVTYVYKGDVYGMFRLSSRLSTDATFFFGTDAQSPEEGYAVELAMDREKKECQATLRRGDKVVAEAKTGIELKGEAQSELSAYSTEDWGEVAIQREGKNIWVKLEGKELLSFRDPVPLRGITLGLLAPPTFDVSALRVTRAQVKDYLFEQAPVDWDRVGTWQITNRFSCDPRWSHMNGESFGLAAFWNKHEFYGDFTIEFYAGMRMRQGAMREGIAWYYPRVGDINLAFCGDGTDIFSGYNLIVAEWDRFWSERNTRIYRRHELLASSDRELIPRTREGRPMKRVIELGWDPGGRPIHGAWYYIKVRRRGKRIDFFFDNVKVMSCEDPVPLAGGRFALWTQHNSIVVARAKIAYEGATSTKTVLSNAEGADSPEAPTPSDPLFLLRSDTHPGLASDFEDHFHGWRPSADDQSAFLTLDRTTASQGEASLKLVNMHTGGDFGVEIPCPRLDLARVTELGFDYRIPAEAKVNLYLTIDSEPFTTYFVHLTGDTTSHAALQQIGDFQAVADGEWHRAAIDLGAALRATDPWRAQSVLKSLRLGNFHEGYLIAGRGGNPAGVWYHLDNFVIGSAGGSEAEFVFEGREGVPLAEFRWLLDTKPGTSPLNSPEAKTVAAEEIVEPVPTPRKEAPKAAAQANGKEKAEGQKEKKPPPPRYAAVVQAAAIKPGIWYLHVAGKASDGTWSEVQHHSFEVAPPLTVTGVSPPPGAKWGGGPIRVQFARETADRLVASTVQLAVAGTAFPAKEPTVTFDPAEHALTIDLRTMNTVFEDGTPVDFALSFTGNLGSIPQPKKQETKRLGKAATEATAWSLPATQKHQWQYVMHLASDRYPPSKVKVNGRLLDQDFEEDLAGLVTYSGQHGAVLTRSSTTASGGRYSLEMTNKVAGGYAGVMLVSGAVDVGRFPVFTCDYRANPHYRADFMSAFGGTNRLIAFTDQNESYPQIGSTPGLSADGRWHHAELDLRSMLDSAMSTFHPNHYTGANFILGDFGQRTNIPGVSMGLDNCSFVAAVSSADGLALTWSAMDPSGIGGYSYKWSKKPDDQPPKKVLTKDAAGTFKNLPEGDQFFHICAQDAAGNWGSTAHYRYRIDNSPPATVKVTPANSVASASPSVELQFRETGSGIDPAALVIKENGVKLALASAFTAFDPTKGVLKWDWAHALAPMRAPIKDKTTRKYEIDPVKDFAGNASKPFSWTWTIDYSKDKAGPVPPKIRSTSEKLLLYHSFTESTEGWLSLGTKGGEMSLHPDEGRRDNCLKIVTKDTWDDSAIYCRRPYYAQTYPFVSFEYNFPPGASLMLRVYVNRQFYCIKLTADLSNYDKLGEVPGIVADGNWHRADFSLLDICRKAIPDTASFYIHQLAIGNWGRDFDQVGVAYYLDNLLITGPSSPAPSFRWSAFDPTGISGYSFALDRETLTEPDTKVDGTAIVQYLPVLEEQGLHYLHVRAQDGAGNWGPAAHHPYYCTDLPPKTAAEGLEAQPGWTASPAVKGSSASLNPVATRSGNKMLDTYFRGAANKPIGFTAASPPLAAQLRAGKAKSLTLNVYHNSATALQVSVSLKLGQKLTEFESAPVAIGGMAWKENAALTATAAAFKSKVPGAKFAFGDIKQAALKFTTTGPGGNLVIDNVQLK